MIGCFIAMIIISLFSIWQYLAFIGKIGFGYVSIFKGHGFILSMIKAMCLKWSIIVAVIGITFGVAGIISTRGSIKAEWGRVHLYMTVFYILFFIGLLF